jgi:hypothetical protein
MKNSQSFPPLVAFLKEIFAFLSFPCCIPESIERYSARRRLAAHGSAYYPGPVDLSGCSSGVEHNLAKVGVEGSNPFARSSFPSRYRTIKKEFQLCTMIGCATGMAFSRIAR